MDVLRQQQMEFDKNNQKFRETLLNDKEKDKKFEESECESEYDEVETEVETEIEAEEEFTKAHTQANNNTELLGSAETLKRCSLQKKDLEKQLLMINKNISQNSTQLGVYMKSNGIPFFGEKTSNNKFMLETITKPKPLSKSEIKKRFMLLFGEEKGIKYYEIIYKPSTEVHTVSKVVYKTEEEISREERKQNKNLKMTQKYEKFLQSIAASDFNTKGFEVSEKQKLKEQLLLALQNID